MLFTKRPKSLLLFFLFILVFIGCIWWMPYGCSNEYPDEADPHVVHELLGKEESCMNCHADYTGFIPSHQPEVIGCTPCHRGDPKAIIAEKAHEDMILVPGNLADVHQTCGAANCHGDIAKRVDLSLMASMSGAITVNRFVFGETDTLDAHTHIKELGLAHAADVHFRQLCASCHLGNPKANPAPVSESSRGGGCIACHLDYSKQQASEIGEKKFHPAINLNITNEHCFGCHSRSGRISTNYEGWHETRLTAKEYTESEAYRLLEDGRIFQKMPSDVHHLRGLECIDCHSANEVMGDGRLYFHEEEAVKISCQDCHFSTIPPTIAYDSLDIESKKIIALRAHEKQDRYLLTHKSLSPIWNVSLNNDNQGVLSQKNSGDQHLLSPPDEACTRGNAHDALTCSACHTAWAPQCVGCHNTYDTEASSYDHIAKEKRQGKWIEHLGVFFAEAPTLGVVLDENQKRKIKAFIPGMIMTIDQSGFSKKEAPNDLFHRLFAPVAPHTIQKTGRSCESCHQNPLAIGYGRGTLDYVSLEGKGKWVFNSEYTASPEDGLPQDAWIDFLKNSSTSTATRHNARPFDIEEQQTILQVGACLSCHDGNSKIMLDAMEDFERVFQKISSKCIIAEFE